MKLKEIGEFGFIERFKPKFAHLLESNTEINNLIGIGDDCAIIPKDNDYNTIVTTDMLMEGVHFLKEEISPMELGFKAVAVNLSDIAAMGGKAVATFLSIAIPPDTNIEYLDSFMEGYLAISEQFNVPLMGGDTTSSLKHLAINVTVVGTCSKANIKMRSGAILGDIICCTGFLGDSAGGLKLVLNKQKGEKPNNMCREEYDYLISKHYHPMPRLKEGEFLSKFASVHSMMDISDGIASDLKHILKASGVSAKIELEKIPLSKEIITYFGQENINEILSMAVGGGEDYELLCTIKAVDYRDIAAAYFNEFNKPLYAIGEIITNKSNLTEGQNSIEWLFNGSAFKNRLEGFNHFSKNNK